MTHAPRAERHETMSCEIPFGDKIYSYSRAQDIEDGVLVSLMLGGMGGFVLGVILAGFREGIRSNARKSADAKTDRNLEE